MIFRYTELDPDLDYKLSCIVERTAQPVEGQFNVQEAVATHGCPQAPGYAGRA